MFVALRDLRFARGRFLLIGSVVSLITILVGFLSGLTGGLATQNISAILNISADRMVFSASSDGTTVTSFSDSAISEKQAKSWADAAGVTSVQPIGINQTRIELGNKRVAIAVFGVKSDFNTYAPTKDGVLNLSTSTAKDLGAAVGDTVTIGTTPYTVESIDGDGWYSHTPVVQMSLTDWQTYAKATGNPKAYSTVLAVSGNANWDAVSTETGTLAQTTINSLMALSAFKSEIGSLLMMVAMLFGISALVIGAFFTVWTMQRKGDIAVLKALGASTRSLIRDSLGQALIVLIIGIGFGIGVVSILGALAGDALPFLLSPLTTLVPGVIMTALGLAGAAFALRSVTSADPLTALGSNR